MIQLRRVRVVGFIEGVSFLLLLGLAMPLKHFAGMPIAVTIFGWIHGILFVLYGLTVLRAAGVLNWSNGRITGAALAAICPLGPFVFDIWLRDEARSLAQLKQNNMQIHSGSPAPS